MSCTYTYKGRKIGNVQEVNDFLLEKLKFESKYGDMVFEMSSRQIKTKSLLDASLKEVDRLNNEYDRAKKASQGVIDGEEYLKMHRPYVGVSEFLSGQRNSEGKLYFPEFIEEEYWSRRFMEWEKGNFTDDEIELFFDGDKNKVTPIPLGNMADWRDARGVLKKTFGTAEQQRLRGLMEEKWKNQAEQGTEIHNVLQQLFTTYKGDLKLSTFLDPKTGAMQKANFIKYILNSKDGSGKPRFKYLDQAKIEQVVDYAINLHQEIEQRYGSPEHPCLYYPEFTLSSQLSKEFNGRDNLQLLGRIDLLVIDKDGNPQIVDYKTSPKIYDDYSTAKKLGFSYQLGTYERMLRRWNINTSHTDVMVAPIQMENFHKEGDQWVFDNVTKGNPDIIRPDNSKVESSALNSLNHQLDQDYLNNNLDEFMAAPIAVEASTQDIISRVKETVEKWFPVYGNIKQKTDEEVKELINDQLGDNWLDASTNSYRFQPKGSNQTIEVVNDHPGAEAEFFRKVKEWYQGYNERLIKRTAKIADALEKGQKEETAEIGVEDSWMKSRLSRYCNRDWEVMKDLQEVGEQFGMIFLHNKITDTIDVVRISGYNPTHVYDWGGKDHTNLVGAHESDEFENSRSDSLMLKASRGNMEMMEAMLVLNNLKFNGTAKIGKISIISPNSKTKDAAGLEASNKELMYCWKKLNQIAAVDNDQFADKGGSVRFLTKLEQVEQEFKTVMQLVGRGNSRFDVDNYSKFNPALNRLTGILGPNKFDIDIALDALNDLRRTLEGDAFGMKKDIDKEGRSIHSTVNDYDSQRALILYLYISQAMLELNGIDIRQELYAHDNWVESYKMWKDGLSGNYIDNANNFGNRLLNQVTQIALEGVQNAREAGFARIRTLRDKTEELKRHSGFNPFVEHTYGNQTSLYDGMTYFSQNGDLLFRNPWDESDPQVAQMSLVQKDYLKWTILEINKNKHPGDSENQILNKTKDSYGEMFQVPLIEASFASKVNTDGWLGWLKNRFKVFQTKGLKEGLKETFENFQSEYLSDEVEQHIKEQNATIFDAVNMMDQASGPDRIKMINEKRQKYGDGFFERDIERLVGTHTWAYATHDAFNERMPLLKAAYISLAIMGNTQNQDYSGVQKFVKEYVQNKINHQSIVDPRYKALKGGVGILQRAASWMALAFSPVQFTYQSLEGIWKDAKLIITKPDGTEAFTLQNMKTAAGTVYKELFHYSDKATVSQAVNAYYGINDMDMASFVDNNSSNNHGIFNFFGKFAYKFSSRPDFYNRMTIFVAQMMKDGSWKAHKVDPKTNQLVYDWKEDDRFRAYATDDKSDMEAYNKSKALYYAVAQQLVREGAKNADGTMFKVGDALPKAYSNKESEAKKAIGDTMYGYYDSTKKSLMQATLIGGLFMQMRTFWSGKKNQYLAPGGIKGQGKWVIMKDPEGQELFYALKENGEIDYNAPWKHKGEEGCSNVNVMQWKGKYEEGIVLTLYDIMKDAHFNPVKFRKVYKEKITNEDLDEDMRKTYQSNVRAAAYDLIMIAILGAIATLAMGWKDDLIKEAKESGDATDAAIASAANIIARSINNSRLDFNWFKSIFEPSMDWNPFAVAYMANEAKHIYNYVTGDLEFSDIIVKSFSAARQVKPMFDLLKAE